MSLLERVNEESCKLVPLFPNYAVDIKGNVYNKYGRKLKHNKNNKGYEDVVLYKTKEHPKRITVHRLVATTFYGTDIYDKRCVNHLDGNKLNNELSNLELTTYKENTRHAINTGLLTHKKGEDHYISKLTNEDVKCIIKRLKEGDVQRKIARDYNVSFQTISFINKGKTWKHIPR